MKNFILLAMLICCHIGISAANTTSPDTNPKANPKAVVTAGNARFTVLTPQLIRMEWSEDGVFEDNATLTFINRNLPVPEFKVQNGRTKVVIRTSDVTLTYRKSGKFSADNLMAEFNVGNERTTWHYGDKDTLNLMGTTRTLDKVDGWNFTEKDPMEPGIISRGGWTVVDDSKRHLMVKTPSHWGEWVECRPEKEYADIYLFAYGHNYRQAIGDYVKVSGKVPLPPRYAFGYWWSRYWQYSDSELRELVMQLKSLDIPIDVLIIDMDWHETWGLRRTNAKKDEYGQRIGWTGYTWKKQLFPSPKNFLQWCKSMQLKTSLNLHPASGIQPYEEPYERFAKEYNWQEQGKSVPFHIDDQRWADAYFNTILSPMEKMGIDFWWLDWQQWKESKYTKGLSNTFWLNHVFNHHSAERNGKRPMIYHRWGGLGSHRYQVGFSGDVYISWESLGMLPWFTATASNVCYGYWGHDIGGHMFKVRNSPTDPELYLRWLQYGVFTPIFKTHSTKDKSIERRVWTFPDHMFMMRDAIRLRYTLAPYIYNAARQAYDTGIAMCRPLYYYYPEQNEAYTANEQYMFGDDLLVTVISSPADKISGLAQRSVWFPEGKWFDMASGDLIEGGQTLVRQYTLNENPYFARAGAVIPMNPPTVKNLQENSDYLVVTCIPGDNGSTELYEDDGISGNYDTKYATTTISQRNQDNAIEVVIAPRKGSFDNAPQLRRYEIRLPAQMPPRRVTINGKEIAYARYASENEWGYDAYTLSPIVYTALQSTAEECVVRLEYTAEDIKQQPRLYGKQGIFNRCNYLTPKFKTSYNTSYDAYAMLPDAYLNVSQAPNFINESPSDIVSHIDVYERSLAICIESMRESNKVEDKMLYKLEQQLK